jgi:hypothetical protein
LPWGKAELTLAEMPAFLTVPSFRSQVMQKVDQPITKLYWERFDQLGKANQLVWTDPVTKRSMPFWQITGSATCSPSRKAPLTFETSWTIGKSS